ncbi:FAD-dependent monooxygenase [Halorarum salinum]|uniref:FAD-dependent monooxygenase n=1 Tax=Halorarum salinum TaxID=2743089 RepID=A0A7D5L9Y7_9EURY|nr:FAD-dependent monooxygenase [Halobaculum salinum]QLG61594.1 FAD-dependent monooxygenase [Halobaculum salinum]
MSERDRDAEVVVVGAGPGGAVLSYLLARSGVDVTLVERERTFEREFRGFGWSPGVVELFDRMGLLSDLLDLDHEIVTEGAATLYGERVELFDVGSLDARHPYVLMMEQPALLELVVSRAAEYDGFTFRPSTTVEGLVTEGGRTVDGGGLSEGERVAGVHARDRAADEDVTLRGCLVVGADGRYSRVRSAAGVDAGLFDPILDLVWFKLPVEDADPAGDTQVRIGRDGILVSFGIGGGEFQIGLPILAGTYPELRSAGIEAFHDRVAAIAPELRPALEEHVTDYGDCSLLEVAPGIAPEWVGDGFLLLGDAAHVASPVGAQGNPLAVADAVAAHATVVGALERSESPLPAGVLARYEGRRRPPVRRIIALQRRAERAMGLFLRYGRHVPPSLALTGAKASGSLLARSRLLRRSVERMALGAADEPVDSARFVD